MFQLETSRDSVFQADIKRFVSDLDALNFMPWRYVTTLCAENRDEKAKFNIIDLTAHDCSSLFPLSAIWNRDGGSVS